MPRRALPTIAVVAVALSLVPTAASARVASTDVHLRMRDGTALAATLWRPPGPMPAAGWPTVVALHGWRGNRASVAAVGRAAAAAGILVVAYDSRGFGQSGGQADLAGPTTVGDLRAIVGWLRGGQGVRVTPSVAAGARADAIALYGRSAGAAQALSAAAGHLRVRAVVAVNPWLDLQASLDPGGIPKTGFAQGFLAGCHGGCTPSTRSALDALRRPGTAAAALPFLRSRGLVGRLRGITAPTMVVQGLADPLFGVDQGLALYRGLSSRVPGYLYLGHLGHSSGPEPAAEARILRARIVAFLLAHLVPAEETKGPHGVELHAIDPFAGVAASTLPSDDGALGWRLAGTGASRAVSFRVLSGGSSTLTRAAPSGWLWGRPLLRLRVRARADRPAADGFSVQLWRTGGPRRHLLATGAASLADHPLQRGWRTLEIRMSFAADDPPAHSRLSLTIACGVPATSVAYGSSLPPAPPGTGFEIGLRGSSLRLPLGRIRDDARPRRPIPSARRLAISTAFGGDGLLVPGPR